MGRPRLKINLELLRRLRRENPKLVLRSLARLYYHLTGQDVSFMSVKRALVEVGLAIDAQGGNNGH